MTKTLPISITILIGKLEAERVELCLQKRIEDGPLNGTWEFPGGKLEAGENPAQAASRELKEEMGMHIPVESFHSFKTYTHHYSDRSVCLFVHLLYFSPESKYLSGLPSENRKWLSLSEHQVDEWTKNIPEANRDILKDLASYLTKNMNDQNWRRHWQQLSC